MKRLLCLLLVLFLPLTSLAEGAPTHVTEQLSSNTGHTTITIDADVIVPETQAIPRYLVRRREFTAAEIHAMANVLFGGRDYVGDEDFYTHLNPEMPNTRFESAYMNLETVELRDGWPLYWLFAQQQYKMADHSLMMASVEFAPSGDAYYRNSGFSAVPEGGAIGCAITLEEAREKANAAVAGFAPQLTLTGEGVMWVCSGGDTDARKETQRYQGYAFGYTRNLPLPVLYEETHLQGDYSNVVCKDQLITVVDDNGIYWMNYEHPYEIIETLEEDCELLSFDKILDVSRAIFPLRYLPYESQYADIRLHVDRITLSSMEVLSRNHPEQCEVIPVWDFFGTAEFRKKTNGKISAEEDTPYSSLLTINALDGTIIDRSYCS